MGCCSRRGAHAWGRESTDSIRGERAAHEPLPAAPAVFTDSLACLKSCVSLTLGPVRPSVEQFHKYLPWFLNDPPNIKCPKG